jgi:hypothetical protein
VDDALDRSIASKKRSVPDGVAPRHVLEPVSRFTSSILKFQIIQEFRATIDSPFTEEPSQKEDSGRGCSGMGLGRAGQDHFWAPVDQSDIENNR